MQTRYDRNIIYIKEREQSIIKDYKILIAGCGIGSYISECLLRMGFENMTIIDGDNIELSNLNRQNYVAEDIGSNKAKVLQKRLASINSRATIQTIPEYITENNLKDLKGDYQVAINALDFSTNVPFLFDEKYLSKGIPVIHPYNLGWAAFTIIFTPESRKMSSLEKEHTVFELNVAKFIVDSLKKDNIPADWFRSFLKEYGKIASFQSPPQLSIGVQLLSAMVSNIIFDMATGKGYKQFPEYYYLSIR